MRAEAGVVRASTCLLLALASTSAFATGEKSGIAASPASMRDDRYALTLDSVHDAASRDARFALDGALSHAPETAAAPDRYSLSLVARGKGGVACDGSGTLLKDGFED
jgi:hypothetical protein